MFRKLLLGALFVSAFVGAASVAQAGKVELTTYLPAPNAEYQELKAAKTLVVPAVPAGTKTTASGTLKSGEIWLEG